MPVSKQQTKDKAYSISDIDRRIREEEAKIELRKSIIRKLIAAKEALKLLETESENDELIPDLEFDTGISNTIISYLNSVGEAETSKIVGMYATMKKQKPEDVRDNIYAALDRLMNNRKIVRFKTGTMRGYFYKVK